MDVKRGPILFRCDGTPLTGWEPLHQCLTLAAALQRRRRGTHFLSYLEPLSLAQTIHRGNNDWTPAETRLGEHDDAERTCREIRRVNAAAVVVAGHNVTRGYLDTLRATGAMVLAIDSTGGIEHTSQLVLNPLLGPAMKAYTFERGTQLLLGRKFALVRGLFRRQRTIRATEQPGAFRALVAFGDDDAGDQALPRTEQLLDMPKVDKVSVFCRPHHPRYHEMQDFCDGKKGRVEVVTEAKEMMTRLVRGHIAVSGGCGWALELACVGIPQLTLPARAGHMLNAKRLDDEGAGTFVGPAADVSFDALHEAVNIVLDDRMERLGMSRCGRNLVDGRGGDRVVNGIEILLHAPAYRRRGVRIAA